MRLAIVMNNESREATYLEDSFDECTCIVALANRLEKELVADCHES
jgi:hypothetical protein